MINFIYNLARSMGAFIVNFLDAGEITERKIYYTREEIRTFTGADELFNLPDGRAVEIRIRTVDYAVIDPPD